MTTHSGILAWEIPWTGGPGGYSPWCQKESDTTETTEHAHVELFPMFCFPTSYKLFAA